MIAIGIIVVMAVCLGIGWFIAAAFTAVVGWLELRKFKRSHR